MSDFIKKNRIHFPLRFFIIAFFAFYFLPQRRNDFRKDRNAQFKLNE